MIRPPRSIQWSIALTWVLAVWTAALPAHAFRSERNAAVWYQRAIDAYEAVDEDVRGLIFYSLGNADEPSDELRLAMAKTRHVLDLVERGSQRQFCDFNLAYEEGFELTLPHLSVMRKIARIVHTDAVIRMHDGDTAGASRRLAVIYRVSDHLTDDRLLISSIVGNAIFNYGDEAVQYGIDRGVFNAADSDHLLRSIRNLDRRDPFLVTEAIAMEGEMALEWFSRRFEDDGHLGNLVEDMLVDPDPRIVAELQTMDEAGFNEQLQGYDDAMQRTSEIYAMDDLEAAAEAFDEFGASLRAGEMGLLAYEFIPAMSRVMELMHESRDAINRRIDVLEAIAQGRRQPHDEQNAAFVYQQAYTLLEAKPVDFLTALRRFDADLTSAIDPALAKSITEMRQAEGDEIFDLLLRASQLRRCDFKWLRQRPAPALLETYHPGMRDLFRLTHVESVHALRDGNASRATELLVAAHHMTDHLDNDPSIASALIAHHGFRRTQRLVRDGITADLFTAEHRARLYEVVRLFGRVDPFGYSAAMLAVREAGRRSMPRNTSEHADTSIRDAVNDLDGDGLITMLVVLDTLRKAGGPEHAASDDELARVDDVISSKAISHVRSQISTIARMLHQGDYGVLQKVASTCIGKVGERRSASSADLRDAVRLLRPHGEQSEE